MASDLVSDYWILGKELFMDHKSLHIPFLTGGMTSSCVASASAPADPVIGNLAGTITFIWAAAVLHVLSKAECARLGRQEKHQMANKIAGPIHWVPCGISFCM
ncbi:hypothetical protein WJX79_006408 [Trebouxia sp. C0005]